MFFVRSQVRHTGFELTQADDAWLLAPQLTRFQNTQPLAYNPRWSPAQFSYQNCEPLPGSVIQPGLNCEAHAQIVLQVDLCMTKGISRVRTRHEPALTSNWVREDPAARGSLTSSDLKKAHLRSCIDICLSRLITIRTLAIIAVRVRHGQNIRHLLHREGVGSPCQIRNSNPSVNSLETNLITICRSRDKSRGF